MSIFSHISIAKPRYNKFDLSHSRKFSMKIGEITPIFCAEAVPGDKFDIKSSSLLRFAPLTAPVMHQSSVYCHFFFVPNRILWSNWEDFITGGPDGTSNPAFPVFEPTSGGEVKNGSLADYLGMPTEDFTNQQFSAMPFAAYNKIYNEYYRDQNLVNPVDDELQDGVNANFFQMNTLQKRAWQHDYFTSALPFTQKGPEATIPLGTEAPILFKGGAGTGSEVYDASGNLVNQGSEVGVSSTGSLTYQPGGTGTSFAARIDNADDLLTDLSTATAASINELRRAFRLQEWLEKNARGGSRYIEVIMSHFGVKSSDGRLQRPEFLGGSANPVTISEVLQTSDNAAQNTPQGNMAGHGVQVGSSKKVYYKCEEHGYIIGLMTVMPKSAYQQGLPKHFFKFDKFDYYWPSFANIGEQPILNQELYYDQTDNKNLDTFGYTPRYAEYKYIPQSVHGEFRKSLDFWHMGRIFTSRPSLNQDFIECDEDEVDRVFAVGDSEENLYVYLHNFVKATRPMPYFGTPTI